MDESRVDSHKILMCVQSAIHFIKREKKGLRNDINNLLKELSKLK